MRAEAYPHGVEHIELVQTHISWVLLTGAFAYKLKRPVRYDFIDLESVERRAFYCSEEVRLNRRFAPGLYLDVCDIHESPHGVRIGGDRHGRVVERCVRMRQFPSAHQLDRLLEVGEVRPEGLDAFGRLLATIHAKLPVSAPMDRWGDPCAIQQAIEQNLEEYLRADAAPRDAPADDDLRRRLDLLCTSLSVCMETRRINGRVRECHGDLHARNIALVDGGLLAFDCIEFEPAFRWIDVAEEIALLLADLASRDCPRHAHAFLSGYLEESGDYQACRLLPLYMAHRALVRAKVNALQARGATDLQKASAARGRRERLVAEARRALGGKSPRLLLMSGLSGSGKTWVASQLAPELNAVHIRSDVERKRLAGLSVRMTSDSAVGGGLYSSQNTADVYGHLAQSAADALGGGYLVIVDATFLKRSSRQMFNALAKRAGVPLDVLHCDAPVSVLRERVTRRQRTGRDASEATRDVLEWQLREREPIDRVESLRVINLDTTGEELLDRALLALGVTRGEAAR